MQFDNLIEKVFMHLELFSQLITLALNSKDNRPFSVLYLEFICKINTNCALLQVAPNLVL